MTKTLFFVFMLATTTAFAYDSGDLISRTYAECTTLDGAIQFSLESLQSPFETGRLRENRTFFIVRSDRNSPGDLKRIEVPSDVARHISLGPNAFGRGVAMISWRSGFSHVLFYASKLEGVVDIFQVGDRNGINTDKLLTSLKCSFPTKQR
jgi:hypothetical protein